MMGVKCGKVGVLYIFSVVYCGVVGLCHTFGVQLRVACAQGLPLAALVSPPACAMSSLRDYRLSWSGDMVQAEPAELHKTAVTAARGGAKIGRGGGMI